MELALERGDLVAAAAAQERLRRLGWKVAPLPRATTPTEPSAA